MPEPTASARLYRRCLVSCLAGISLVTFALWTEPVAASSLRRSAIVQAVSEARPSVVNIHGRKVLPAEHDQRDHFSNSEPSRQVNGMGTGVVIDPRGYVITNYHVVDGVRKIQVTLADGNTVTATLVANDPETDLAIIKIASSDLLPVIEIGTSADLMPGETVIAVGNAYGYENTVTQGIVSALHRTVQVSDYQKYVDLIQTDASINPGNSGGPLLNIDGEMVGINVAVRVGAQGIGFAIPIDQALEVAAELIATAHVNQIMHGMISSTVYKPDGSYVTIEAVEDGSPAAEAGLQAGDIIRSLGNEVLQRRLDLERVMLSRKPGEELAVTVERQTDSLELSLVLGRASRLKSTVTDRTWQELGVRLSPIAQSTFRKYRSRYRGGLMVEAVRPNSPASQQNISRGDVLVGMHKWETISLDNIAYILESAEFRATQPFRFYVLRNGETLYGNMRVAGRP
jgi:serine protease Do